MMIRNICKWIHSKPPLLNASFISLNGRKRYNDSKWLHTTVGLLRRVNETNREPAEPVTLARRLVPDDANVVGNIHGGHILQLMEEAGHIAATKHCNSDKKMTETDNTTISNTAYMTRLEHMDFLQPMFVNEIAQAKAEVVFVSEHSLAVEVKVTAENIYKGTRRLTNRGILWYVHFNVDKTSQNLDIAKVPPLSYNIQKQQEYRQLYESRKRDNKLGKDFRNTINESDITSENIHRNEAINQIEGTIVASESVLAHLIMPSDCYEIKFATGGCLMKLMDTAAAMVGIRHCKSAAVTASINDIDFYRPVKLSSLITIVGRLTFTSGKSMETNVRVFAKNIRTGSQYIASSSFFNMVAMDSNCMPLKVPPLVLTTDDEKRQFEEGRVRYENRKKSRVNKMD
ncbi:Cytosolic acyl coenzyme A thioester hydrolase [Trichoplax sp. H2]|uniref:HotDog ACOT-type domain-containing protein n=1 Tax=Trichoplax adhaerens TaxID=10228 RepID=B3S1I8_TRIAD|nr:hypothetical protein TRIADDRAFT_58305 [Trichoplax adhaerens]EDV23233.1 hypothetical protein TRIADDRAFT_58305 [Trichoplax adhaerens]RDD44728.1 Cytosolic acyl coenzyme A thioester hydrolase [Trichoplax sp. H2]|eukprot:XP_002114143.1 hypothetical protein TRIADDRAFT_58305 [Trichoplax adhaerens]